MRGRGCSGHLVCVLTASTLFRGIPNLLFFLSQPLFPPHTLDAESKAQLCSFHSIWAMLAQSRASWAVVATLPGLSYLIPSGKVRKGREKLAELQIRDCWGFLGQATFLQLSLCVPNSPQSGRPGDGCLMSGASLR